MTDAVRRRLVVWEARHDNGWTTLILEQPDGTFVAWAGLVRQSASITSRTRPNTRKRRRCSR
jgi:hypothetical protein